MLEFTRRHSVRSLTVVLVLQLFMLLILTLMHLVMSHQLGLLYGDGDYFPIRFTPWPGGLALLRLLVWVAVALELASMTLAVAARRPRAIAAGVAVVVMTGVGLARGGVVTSVPGPLMGPGHLSLAAALLAAATLLTVAALTLPDASERAAGS